MKNVQLSKSSTIYLDARQWRKITYNRENARLELRHAHTQCIASVCRRSPERFVLKAAHWKESRLEI